MSRKSNKQIYQKRNISASVNAEGVMNFQTYDPKSKVRSSQSNMTARNAINNQIRSKQCFLSGICNSRRRKQQTARTMFSFVFVVSVCLAPVFALLPMSPLKECPNLPSPEGIRISQVTGSWRLAYAFIDDDTEMEEDHTCAVVEIMKVNDTKLEMLLFVDGRTDEFTIDRYTKEFEVTVLSPGEWLFHTNFMHLEFIQVTVIGFSEHHLILKFCVDPFEPVHSTTPSSEVDSFINIVDRDSMDDIFKAQNFNNLFKDMDGWDSKPYRQRKIRRPSNLLRRKRFARSVGISSEEEDNYDKLMRYLRGNKSHKPKKHLWTIILVKDNNTSALKFVENASLLMKYGYKITDGQLVSFGSCGLKRK